MTKIKRLEIENVKKVQVVDVQITQDGLTVFGGRNGQGKSTLLDAAMWGLGGDKYRPSNAARDGSLADPRIKIELDNGIVVERSGKNSSLKVLDMHGNKAGQTLLSELLSQIAIDAPKFLIASPKEKAKILLQVLGIGDQLHAFDIEESKLYEERRAVGTQATRKKKHAEDLPSMPNAPAEEVSALELLAKHNAILAANGENQRKRDQSAELLRMSDVKSSEVTRLQERLDRAKQDLAAIDDDLTTARRSASDLHDESTAEIERNLQEIDETNRKVRINAEKARAESDASTLQDEYDDLTGKIESVRTERLSLLDGADLPLPDLSIEDGELVYLGQKWDCMSSSEQLRVAVAIARKLKPDCRFVLLDKTEQMDVETLMEFGQWAESEGLQIIATRVSTGDECSIIIEDGMVAEDRRPLQKTPDEPARKGAF